MATTCEDVCLVIDMECFRVNGRLHCRELGYCNWMGDSGRVAFLPKQPFHPLTRDDKRHIQFVTRHIHGLSYYPDKGEDVTSSVDDAVQQLYQAFVVDHRRRVAFKGGHVERDLLLHLNIPFLDLETLGCPKYDALRGSGDETCGWHAIPAKHDCAMAECKAFFVWYQRYFNPEQDEPMDMDDYPPTEQLHDTEQMDTF